MTIIHECPHCHKVMIVRSIIIHLVRKGVSGYGLMFRCKDCARVVRREATKEEAAYIARVGAVYVNRDGEVS